MFLCFILYRIFCGFGFVPFFIVSLLISSFIFNQFRYSENIFVRYLQKFAIYNLLFLYSLIILICVLPYTPFSPVFDYFYYLYDINLENFELFINENTANNSTLDPNDKSKDVLKVNTSIDNNNEEFYNLKVRKDIVNSTLETVKKAVEITVKNTVPSLGAGAATGAATAAMVKSTQGIPPVQRLGLIGATAVVTSGATAFGLKAGSALAKNINVSSIIENSRHADPDINRIPSPDLENIIQNPLEIGDTSPLETILTSIFAFNVFILLLTIIILYLIFNRYILHFNLDLITSLFDKYMSHKINERFKSWLKKGTNYNNRFIFIMFIVNSIVLIFLILLNIIFTADLLVKIEDYVNVYNFIHGNNGKNSIIFLIVSNITINSKNIPLTYSKRSISTKDFQMPRYKLMPWQVTGLTDSEGCFNCSISKTEKGLVGKTVRLEFKVTQKTHSEGVLYELLEFFGCGNVVIDNRKSDTKKYHITSISPILDKIIPHFELYPCLTSKNLNFKDWKEIALIMKNKEHLTKKGMDKIINFSLKLNKNRSFEDKYNYCKTTLGLTVNLNKEFEIKYDLPSYWVQAFLTGEAMFYTYVSEKLSRGKVYQGCDSSLELGQNNHDVAILLSLKKFFNGGYIKPKYNYNNLDDCKNSHSVNRYILRNNETIAHFLDLYPMLTRKQLDYLDWKKIVELKNLGAHKTLDGLNLIKKIISNVNSKREFKR
jgi:hypothetical protein